MLIVQRHQRLYEILREQKTAQLEDLSRALGVSASTVRRDLTVLETAEPLAREDPECARIVLERLRQDGITLRTGVSVAHIETEASGVALVMPDQSGHERIVGSHLLVATGRRP